QNPVEIPVRRMVPPRSALVEIHPGEMDQEVPLPKSDLECHFVHHAASLSAVRIETLIDVPGNLCTSPQRIIHPGRMRLRIADSGRIATRRPPGHTMLAACSTCASQRPSLNGG